MSGLSDQQGLDLVQSVVEVSRETQERLTIFHSLLKQWQAKINLIAPSTIDHIWERHIADSMQCVPLAHNVRHLVDLGSGAGFPGLVMAICMVEAQSPVEVSFVESVGKKCAFIRAVVRETGLGDTQVVVSVHNDRIENILPTLPQPEMISARALAPLDRLMEMTQPHLTNGCVGLFPKGQGHEAEIIDARRNWEFELEQMKSRFSDGSVILKISKAKRRD